MKIMEPFAVILMRKDSETGFLESEVGSYNIPSMGEYLESIFVIDKEEEDMVHLRITTATPVKDWEYSAIYDYYDEDRVSALDFVIKVEPIEDDYDPLWEVTFKLLDNIEETEEQIQKILETHHIELQEVMQEIKDKEEEYK